MPDENIYSVENALSINLGTRNSTFDSEPEDPPEDPRMIEGVVIFVRSYSVYAHYGLWSC